MPSLSASENGVQFGQLRSRPFSGVAADEIAELEDHRISDAVADVEPLSSSVHQTLLAKRLQVFGNVGLTGFQHLHNIADRLLSIFQRLKDAQAHWLSQRAKTSCNYLGHGFSQHCFDFIHMFI